MVRGARTDNELCMWVPGWAIGCGVRMSVVGWCGDGYAVGVWDEGGGVCGHVKQGINERETTYV